MLLRIRSPSGTGRVEVSDNANVTQLKQKIFEALKVSPRDQILSTNPAGTELLLDDNQLLTKLSIKHGDMLYLITDAPSPAPSTSSPSSSSNHVSTPEEPVRCTHGPNAVCVKCAPPPATEPTKKKCNHGPNEKCVNCQTKKYTGKKIEWLCTHPPGGKCINCTRVPKKVASKCNHPSNMFCPNCLGSNGKESKKQEPLRCQHGPNGACANCRPASEEDDNGPVRCRHHGPHGSCIECIERVERKKMRLKLQDASHCTGAVVYYEAAKKFQNYLHEKKFQVHRCGILYGSFMEDGSTVIDVIYEPPQVSSPKGATMVEPDPDMDKVESIANMLGLQRVGWIFSHPSRSYLMSAAEIAKTAEMQNKADPRFVTLVMSLDEKTQLGNLEAFQVSDQALKLQREGMFLDSPDPAKLTLRQPVIVEGAETTTVDYHFFLVTVPVRSKDKSLFHTDFPIENRQHPQAKSDLKVHMMHTSKRPFLDQVTDFHLLFYLAKGGYFDLKTDLPALCEAVRSRNADHLEGFKILMESFIS